MGDVVEPTMQSVSDGTYEPLSRPLFIYVRKEAAQQENVQQFVHFYLDNAPMLAEQIGYIPMPDSVYQVQRKKFEAFTGQTDSVSVDSDN